MVRRFWLVSLVLLVGFGAGTAVAQRVDSGVAAAVGAGRVGANLVVGSGTIASNGAPTTAVRIDRNGEPSACGSVKSYPGDFGSPGPYAYQTISYTNTGPSRCVTFTYIASCTGGGSVTGTFLAAYNGAFNPANLSVNYIGDTGFSAGPGETTAMALNLAQNQTITFMVGQVNAAATSPVNTCNFSLADDHQVVVPAMSAGSMAAMAGVLALLGFVLMRRRAGQR